MSNKLKICSKIWIEKNGEYAFGSGIAEILAAVRKTGSLSEAAELLGESYRYLWGRIRKTERVFGRKLVQTTVGGHGKKRAKLTVFGNKIIGPYMKFEKDAVKHVDAGFARLMKNFGSK
ncbi:MAG: LysR family transcriptional regulator [Planctomycetes bacterium]|nr:LysR family transcriptional regulator [Planctomycetota bacterium]